VNEDLWHYAFDILSPTDLDHKPIERPNRTVRYSFPESQQIALLAGTRYDGRPVIDGTNGLHVYVKLPENTYVLQSSRASTATLGYKTGIRVQDLDGIIEAELLGMLKVSEYAAAHPEKRTNFDLEPNWHTEMADLDNARQAQTKTNTPQDRLIRV
jgi:hypothetical protein